MSECVDIESVLSRNMVKGVIMTKEKIMRDQCVSIAEMKSHFSEYVGKSAYSQERFVKTKRDKPVAALVSLEDYQSIEQPDERKGLAGIVGMWSDYDEIEQYVADCSESCYKGDNGREVSL